MKTETKRTGRIYQLVNMITNQRYIGSTIQTLPKRQYWRKVNYNKWLKDKHNRVKFDNKLFQNIYEYGWECFRCELLAEVEVNNKTELHKIEGDWIRKLDTFNNGLNGLIPNRDQKEYRLDNREKRNQEHTIYYQNNKHKWKKYNNR